VLVLVQIEPYFADYGEEMVGLSNALGLDLGEIVATNMIYQLERIGVRTRRTPLPCLRWPCPPCFRLTPRPCHHTLPQSQNFIHVNH